MDKQPCECRPGGCPSIHAANMCAALERYCKIAEHDALRREAVAFRWLEAYLKSRARWPLVSISRSLPMIEAIAAEDDLDDGHVAPTLLAAVEQAISQEVKP